MYTFNGVIKRRPVTMVREKKNGGAKRRGMLAVSLLLAFALIIPQAAMAASPDGSVGIAADKSAQTQTVLENAGGGGAII
jgi:hypothetical protein